MEDSDYDFAQESEHDLESCSEEPQLPLGFGRGTQGYKGIPHWVKISQKEDSEEDEDDEQDSQMDEEETIKRPQEEIQNLPFWKWIGSPAFPSNLRASTRWVKKKHIEATKEQERVKKELNKLIEKRDQLEQGIQALDAYMKETKDQRIRGYKNRIRKTDAADKALLVALTAELELSNCPDKMKETKKKIVKLKAKMRDKERKRRGRREKVATVL